MVDVSAAKKSAVDAEKEESTETAVAAKVRTVVYLIFYFVTQTLTTLFFKFFLRCILFKYIL